jgi:alkaline phosphatase
VRWRNQILALLCLTIFFAFGVLYFRHWVVQKPFGIILFIGEGLTPDRLAATRLYAGGADSRLTIETLPAMALLRNESNDFAVPDEAAAATTLATGVKVNNRSIGIDPDGNKLKTILDRARDKGRTIGLVTNGRLTNPTAAAFFAHSKGRPDEIAQQFADEKKIEIALGGGGAEFLPEAKGGQRTDSRDLILDLRRNGFEIVRSKAELENVPRWRRSRVLGLFSSGEMAFANQIAAGSEQPSLADMTRRAIELLQWNPGGYFLIVDANLMGAAARENKAEMTLTETLELDRAVGVARSYAGDDATILVAGNLGIGGLALNGSPFRKDKGIALLGVNAAGAPAVTWATGPDGPRNASNLNPQNFDAAGQNLVPNSAHVQEPAAVYSPSAENTVTDALVAGRGPGSEALRGVRDNTIVFQIIEGEL